MAWTTPKTWSVGDVLTAADLNTYVRDQFNYAHGSAQPRCRVIRTSNQSFANGTDESADWTSADYDPQNMWGSSGDEEVVIPTGGDGIYSVQGAMQFDTNNTGYRFVYVELNGIDGAVGETAGHIGALASPFTTGRPRIVVADDWDLAAADELALTGEQSSGGALNMEDAYLSVRWVGS